jgi:hypothetical protein
MQALSGILVAALFVHLQCAGSCLTAATQTEPPCHQHSGAPEKQPAHEQNSLCSQAPVAEAKLLLKSNLTLPPAAVLPILDFMLRHARANNLLPLADEGPPGLLSSPVSLSILRI